MTYRGISLALGLTVALCAPNAARSAVMYFYDGQNFTSASGQVFSDPFGSPSAIKYTTGMKVTGEISLDMPLAGNLLDADISADLLSASFFDGINTLTQATSVGSGQSFKVTTDAAGNITGWDFFLHSADVGSLAVGQIEILIRTLSAAPPGSTFDQAVMRQCLEKDGAGLCTSSVSSIAFNSSMPGSWSRLEPSAVPLPAALPLFAGGLALLGLLGWRRRYNVAAA